MEHIEEDTRSLPEVIMHTVILALTTALALIGNSLVCFAFYRNRRLRTITNYYVLSLAVADIMMATFLWPSGSVASGLRRWPFNYSFCKVCAFISISWGQISIWILTLASVNRYFRVVKPNKYSQFFTKKKTISSIVVTWICSFVISLIGWATNDECQWSLNTLFYNGINFNKSTERIIYLFITCFYFVPMSLVVFCYVNVYQFLRQHNATVIPSLQTISTGSTGAHEIKASRVIFAAVLGFCLSWTPFVIISIIQLGLQEYILYTAQSICLLLTTFSSWINPIIYGVMNQAMRKEFRNIFLCRKE